MPILIQGLESCTEWNKIFSSPDEDIDISTVENDVIASACSIMKLSDIGAFVLECTDLPLNLNWNIPKWTVNNQVYLYFVTGSRKLKIDSML